MAFSFGAATSNRISGACPGGMLGSGAAVVVGGWFKPTTLTAARAYLGFGTTAISDGGIRVGATTSELEIVHDCSTTDPVFTTSGAGIVTNEWVYIGLIFGAASGAGTAFMLPRVFLSRDGTTFTEVSVSKTTSGAGTYAATHTVTVGNATATTPARSFQGLIDRCMFARVSNAGSRVLDEDLTLAGDGTFPDAQTQQMLDRLLYPHMRGVALDFMVDELLFNTRTGNLIPASATTLLYLFDAQTTTPQTHHGIVTTNPQLLRIFPTVSGATFSNERAPGGMVLPNRNIRTHWR